MQPESSPSPLNTTTKNEKKHEQESNNSSSTTDHSDVEKPKNTQQGDSNSNPHEADSSADNCRPDWLLDEN